MSPGFLPRTESPVASSELLEGVVSFSPSAQNGLVSATAGASGFPAVDVQLVPRFNTVKEDRFVFFFFFLS